MKEKKEKNMTEKETAAMAAEIAEGINKAVKNGGDARQILDIIITLVAPICRLEYREF